MLRHTRVITGLLLIIALMLPQVASAQTPYNGYIWNAVGEDAASINGYLYLDSIEGAELPTGTFKDPEGLFIGKDDSVYIVDTGNSRIVHLDSSNNLLRIIGDQEGPGVLTEPKGVFVKDDGTLYVADTKNHRIVLFDSNGVYLKEFKTPESQLLGAGFSYSPSRLVVDKRDYMYVVSDGNTQGLMQIDPNGEFKGFYGANHIGFSLKRLFIKLIATKEQRSQLTTVKPAEYAGVDLDNEGFIYTTTLGTATNQLKRLSPVGVDTLNIGIERQYGDLYSDGPFSVPSFLSISVDEKGFITAMDLQSSKVYQYDKLGNMLFSFGGRGDQNGLFVTPAGIDQSSDGIVYVTDKGRNRIDRFRTTLFAELVHEASSLYVDGRYEEAEQLWNQVLKQNANYEMAYLAIGKALYKSEQYKESMQYFKLARNKFEYSIAFKEYRKEYIREHFTYFFTGAIALILILRWGIPFSIRRFKIIWKRLKAERLEKGRVESI